MTAHVTRRNGQYATTWLATCTRCPGWREESRYEAIADAKANEHNFKHRLADHLADPHRDVGFRDGDLPCRVCHLWIEKTQPGACTGAEVEG